MPTAANLEGVDLSKYKVVIPGTFVFSGMQTGRDVCIRIGLYSRDRNALVSPAYTTFMLKKNVKMLPEFFFMYFNRLESDRRGWFLSDSSVRANLDWPRFLDIEIPVPPIDEQRKVVETWQGLRAIKEQNEQLAAPLLALCRSALEKHKKTFPMKSIGGFIRQIKEKNSDNAITLEQGINIEKEFITPQRTNSDLSSRIIVRTGQIAYCTQLNNANVAVAYRTGPDCVVSPVYNVIEIVEKDQLLDEYLFLCLCRPEFGRYVYWASKGSAYEFLVYDNLCSAKIPIPPLKVQQAVVDLYHCAVEAKKIAAEADAKSREICPALMQWVVKESA